MSRNGSGTYSLPAGNPVVTGTTITTTWANTTLNDIAGALTGSVAADGQTPMTGNLNMANSKIISLGTPTLSTDAVTKAYVDAKTDGTASGSFTDLAYTGTLTGGTGVVNLGSGQFYKDASGNVGIGTASPASTKLHSYQTSGSTIAGLFQTNQTDAFATFQGSSTSSFTTVRIGATGDNLVAYAGGSERMRIDSSGNVGIGNANPTTKLEVFNNTTGSAIRASVNDGAGSSSFGYGFYIVNAGYDLAQILAYYDTSAGGGYGGLIFNTRSAGTTAERMRIDPSGNLLVGTTTARAKMSNDFNGSTNNGIALNDTASANGTAFAGFYINGTLIGSIQRVGTTSAVAYNTTSDQRLKSNIEDANPVLNKLMTVKVRQFDWTDGNLHQDAGFIAQEFETVFPECVGLSRAGGDGIEYKNINHETLIPTLVKAIQELKAEFDAYKATHP